MTDTTDNWPELSEAAPEEPAFAVDLEAQASEYAAKYSESQHDLTNDVFPVDSIVSSQNASPQFAQNIKHLKTPPHSVEAERSLLGGLMLSVEAWDFVSDVVHGGDFYLPKHQQIFSELANLADAAEPLDIVTLAGALEKKNILESAGGLNYLVELVKNTPSAANIRAYADIVQDRAKLRRIISVATNIQEMSFNPEGREASDVLDSAERLILQVGEEGPKTGGAQDADSLIKEAIDKIGELFEKKGKITGLTTGFTDLDEKTSGLQNSDLVIVAGRPSMGKTSFAMNLVENALFGSEKPVLVFSMEMPAHSLMTRMLSSVGRIDQTRVRNGQLQNDDWDKLQVATQRLKGKPLYIDDTPALTPTEVRSRARRISREHGELGMIMLDYLQLMQVAGGGEGRTQEISEISRSLKTIAKEFNCPVVALSQLNRSLEQRPNKRPVMSDLRESGAIEQDADVIMFIYRDEVYNEDTDSKGMAEIIIGKQRNGPIGSVNLAFRGEFTRFENYTTGADQY